MYECDGQMSLSDFMDSPKDMEFCWDKDINEIRSKLVDIADKHNIKHTSEWDIWNHVPQFGYRMSFYLEISKSDYTQNLLDELNEVVEFAKDRKVELSIMNPFFFHSGDKTTMSIYSTFNDKERRKVK